LAYASIDAKEFVEGMTTGIEKPFKISESIFERYKNEVLEGITSLNEAIEDSTLKAG